MNDSPVQEFWGEEPTDQELNWFYGTLERFRGHKPSQNGAGGVHAWSTATLADITDEPPLPPSLGSLGLLYPGKRHVWSGPQESAKTLAAYIAGLSVIRTDSQIVLVDFEMGPWDAKRRFRELGANEDELGRVTYIEPQTPSSAASVEKLLALEPALVIVDAAAGAFQLEGLDDNARRDVEIWSAGWIAPFWRAKVATLVLDHVTKNAETRGNYAIGSERKIGGADVHLGFAPIDALSRGGSGRYKITTHKDRGGFLKRGRLADMLIQSDPESHALTWQFVAADDERDYFRPTRIMEKVSRYLELQTAQVSRSEVKEHVEAQAKGMVQALDALLIEGFTTELSGAHGAKLVASVRPFREAEHGSCSVPFSDIPERDDTSRSVFPVLLGTGTERTDRVENDGGEGSTRSAGLDVEF